MYRASGDNVEQHIPSESSEPESLKRTLARTAKDMKTEPRDHESAEEVLASWKAVFTADHLNHIEWEGD